MYRYFSFKNEGVEEGYFERVCGIVLRKGGELCGIKAGSGFTFTLVQDDSVPVNAYRIALCEDGVKVSASDKIGLISGCGRVLQEGTFNKEGFLPGSYEGEFVPKGEFVGTYFASHFGNYYVNAPLEEVCRYVEDLALWGSRFLRVWFDFHHYTGIDDPKAQPMLERLETVLTAGKELGMKLGFVSLANEGYSTTPDSMKAEWWPQNGYHTAPCGHYHTEICPNKEGGIELILKNRLGLFERFKKVGPDLLNFGNYDQGGCTCAKCAPWGSNGYIKTIKALIPEVKKRFPNCRMGFSTWYLDHFIDGEWDKVYDAIETDDFLKENIQYITGMNMNSLPKNGEYAEKLMNGIGPSGKLLMGFPEISMQGCSPWGGFGANPYPQRLQNDWDKLGHVQVGMWSYSEGKFEDINKFIVLGLYNGRYATAQDAMLGYVKAELSSEYADEIMKLLNILEETLQRTREYTVGESPDTARFIVEKPERIEEAAELAQELNKKLPENIRSGWRWQMIYLRCMADLELKKADFYIREDCEKYLFELNKLYYTDDATYYCVSPATRWAIDHNYGRP